MGSEAHTVGSAEHKAGSAEHKAGSVAHTVGSAAHTVGSAAHTVGSAAHTVDSAGHKVDSVEDTSGSVDKEGCLELLCFVPVHVFHPIHTEQMIERPTHPLRLFQVWHLSSNFAILLENDILCSWSMFSSVISLSWTFIVCNS